MFSKKPGLEKTRYLCGLFDNPQEAYPSIYITGTNGKGSATAMLANILAERGNKTGRFISPYIYDFAERISINNINIPSDDIIRYTKKIKNMLESVPEDYMPNTFGFITLIAFLYYRDKSCDIAVIETGLGGRLDPTSVIKSPLVSLVMQIGLDHTDILGDTVEKIAFEECSGAARCPVIIYPNPPSVIKIAEQTSRELIIPDLNKLEITSEDISGAEFIYKGDNYKLKLAGRHQIYNALTVIETAKYIGADYGAIYNGISGTDFPARLEIISRKPLLIFDGAHNMPAVCGLRDNIKRLLPGKIILICGMLKDKQPEHIIKNIAGEDFVAKFIAVPVNNPRAVSASDLRDIASECGADAEAYADLRVALAQAMSEAARDNLAVVAFGSLYLAGEIKRAYEYLIGCEI